MDTCLPTSPPMHTGAVIEAWLNYQQLRGFSHRTIERRRATAWRLARQAGSGGILKATSADVERVMGSMPSPRSRSALLSDMRMLFQWACRRGLAGHDPTLVVDRPMIPRGLPRPVRLDDAMAALDACTNIRLRRAFVLGMCAGLRRAEIASLYWEDVIVSTGVLIVRSGKGSKDRVVPMHPLVVDALTPARRSGPVIGWTPYTVGTRIAAHLRECGVDATCHQLRHTFGTEAAAHADLRVVAQLMGHASVTTTEGYAQLAGGLAAPAVAAMFRAS